MKITVIDNLESSLPRNIINVGGKATIVQSIAPNPNITGFDFDIKSNKYAPPPQTEKYAEDYIENGEFPDSATHTDGGKKTMLVNAYERNPELRSACIDKYGVTCIACKRNFEQTYGERGKDFIEVHHINPLHTVKGRHDVSVDDLRPLCSNCHSMIHRKRNDELTIEQLQEIIRQNCADSSLG